MREDRDDGASLAGRFGSPRRGMKMFDQYLIYAIIGGKNPNGGSIKLIVNLMLTRGHGSLPLEPLPLDL
jgi:hypothetical protein